jgi:hypothetical protein
MLTKHGRTRAQQRGIPPLVVDLLLDFGRIEYSGDGTVKHFLDKRACQRLRAYAGPLASLLEAHLGCYIVVGEHGRIVTVAHRTGRLKH